MAKGSGEAPRKARGSVAGLPPGCSVDIPVARARGPLVAVREHMVVPRGADDWDVVESPYPHGCAARARDVFDVMADQARRRGGVPALPDTAVDAGRVYCALYHRVAAGNVTCSRAHDPVAARGQGTADAMDVYMITSARLARMQRAIGDGVALAPQRSGARDRRAILVRVLVDQVCVMQSPLSAVLQAHGWTNTGKTKKVLQAALAAALGRMWGC